MPRRSPLTSVTPALSIATSVPVPMAMPTSACASAGASLMPSPAIATLRPSACRRLTCSALSSGSTSADRLVDAELRARRLRRCCCESPVSITMRTPERLSAAIASGVLSLIGSATAAMPRARAVDGEEHDRLRLRAPGFRARFPALRIDAALAAESRGCRRATCLPADVGLHAQAVDRLEIRDRPQARGRAPSRPSTIAMRDRVLGRAAPRPRPARALRLRRCPRRRNRSARAGRASACRSCPPPAYRCRACARSPRRCGTGCRRSAPCPIATVIEIGVARPTAQGQAMISTATALSSA